VLLVTFGIVVGAGIVRYTEPDPMAGQPQTGSRPLAQLPLEAPPASAGAPPVTGGTGRVIPREVLHGMLQAARTSLAEGRYGEAIAAYQAVLKRDPKNVDAMTHLALIVAIGGGPEHVDRALEAFDKALALDPTYLPALLYRGQVLYEIKKDTGGAIRSWEKYVAVSPPGEDRDRVTKMIEEARSKR
jgi:Tetratricopeptide repeat